ncbi:MAG: hypothetical protein OEU46_24100, partial [Alphaproteobacteria bacterium]|nr:hypothetical protein [Alphaproteobacteria bacterium]
HVVPLAADVNEDIRRRRRCYASAIRELCEWPERRRTGSRKCPIPAIGANGDDRVQVGLGCRLRQIRDQAWNSGNAIAETFGIPTGGMNREREKQSMRVGVW